MKLGHLSTLWPLQVYQGSLKGTTRGGRKDTVGGGGVTLKEIPAKPNLTTPHLYFSACGQVGKATEKKCSHTD